MCLMMYLGSRRELRLRKNSHLSIELLTTEQAVVRNKVPEPHVYFVGSHSGCRCGFPSVIAESNIEYYAGMFEDENAEREDDLLSVRELLCVLDECLADEEACTLFPVWNGAESDAPKGDVLRERREWTPETFVVTEQFRYRISAEQTHATKRRQAVSG